MKLKFKNQEFQTDAVNSVVDLFLGQEKTKGTFSVDNNGMDNFLGTMGVGNALLIDQKTLADNMHAVQRRNNLPLTDPDWGFNFGNVDFSSFSFQGKIPQFSIEMETGTGKTYVYTKTIFELNRKYGFTKFIIVVPSVAIREGVYKSFEVTKEHFGLQYDNVPCRYFIYNSAKLSDVRQFATSANIEIMIINIDAFKKAENIINQAQDRLNGDSAMRFIQDIHPIVIIDEPQSVDNTPKAKAASYVKIEKVVEGKELIAGLVMDIDRMLLDYLRSTYPDMAVFSFADQHHAIGTFTMLTTSGRRGQNK